MSHRISNLEIELRVTGEFYESLRLHCTLYTVSGSKDQNVWIFDFSGLYFMSRAIIVGRYKMKWANTDCTSNTT